jgi:dolichyl-phosphate beta-glucosyltransferase
MAKQDKKPFLSFIIPVFNERKKIADDVRLVHHFLYRHGLKGEIIVVDDGSRDGTTGAAKRAASSADRVIAAGAHRGKGFAVKTGMAASRGGIVLFMDSGRCFPPDEILRGLRLIDKMECDMAHASRRLHGSVIFRPQPVARRISALLFRRAAAFLFPALAHLTDTQMGLKIYRGNIGRELFSQCRCDGFLFDIEIILKALRSGFVIREFPVSWRSDPDSRLSLTRMPLMLAREYRLIRKTGLPRRD